MTEVRPSMRLLPPSRPGPRPPVERLASLKHPIPIPIQRPQLQPKPTTHPKTATCPNPSCPAPNIVEDDGQKVCSGCGTVVSDANIVSEITFGESSSGAAIVQGTFVGADQSHGRSFGPGFQRGGGMESREITEQNGNRYIGQLSRALNIPESASKAGGQVFKLAVGLNFIQGRRTKTVAAVCLYIACRRQDGNTVMLIDFADVLMINVFKLGRAYKALLDELRLGGNVFLMNPIDPESLIYRFAKQLEFGSSMMQVASEAVRIVQRMSRDWMITGRRPAGICGAALILAARMNNFRRTVREVVYVVKVTELTIHQRLNEFKATESGDLTVDQFRSVQLENAHDPPSFTQSKEGKRLASSKKRKIVKVAADVGGLEPAVFEAPPPTRKARRVDADGFTIPDIPIDPAMLSTDKVEGVIDRSLTSAVNTAISELEQQPVPSPNGSDSDKAKPRRGRSKASKNSQVPPPTASELASESALEDEMTALLSSGSKLLVTATPPASVTQATPPTSSTTSVATVETTPDPALRKRTPRTISSSTEIDSSEFDSDPEVINCLLSPPEIEIKERIWVHENKDYLRSQQAKALKRALAEETSPTLGQANRPRKRRRGRIGDVGYLERDSGQEGGKSGASAGGKNSTRASTPAEATRRMLEKRGFSKKINYRLLEEMYEDDDVVDSWRSEEKQDATRTNDGGNHSRSGSRSRSVRSGSVVSDRSAVGVRGPIRTRMVKGTAKTTAAPTAAMTMPSLIKPLAVPPAAGTTTTRTTLSPPHASLQFLGPENPNEEILGLVPSPEPGEGGSGKQGTNESLGSGDEDEEDEDEEGEKDKDEEDGVEAAFAGNFFHGEYGDDDFYDD